MVKHYRELSREELVHMNRDEIAIAYVDLLNHHLAEMSTLTAKVARTERRGRRAEAEVERLRASITANLRAELACLNEVERLRKLVTDRGADSLADIEHGTKR